MRSTNDWGRATRWAGIAVLVTLAFGATPQQADAKPVPVAGVQLVPAWPGVKFNRPIAMTSSGATCFIAEQEGRILRIGKFGGNGPVPQPAVYMDMKSRVDSTGQGGVLSMALHPQFQSNGRFFISYLAPGTGGHKFEYRVCEFQGNAAAGNLASERPIVRLGKKRNTHQAGGIAFGPDGMLYVGIGDGMDPRPEDQMVVQSPKSKLGKFLRIDVSTPNTPKPPADNPWATLGDEFPLIWAYGFRNPWRFDWDSKGRLWAVEPGMKGPTSQEWIIEVKRGSNGRWPYYEGNRKRPEVPGEPRPPAVAPAFSYNGLDTGGDNCGIGGKFYRGKRLPALAGKFIFCDFMRGTVYSLDLSSGTGTGWSALGQCKGPADIGQDAEGELYISAIESGVVYTLMAK